VRAIRTQLALPHVSDVDFSWWGAYSDVYTDAYTREVYAVGLYTLNQVDP
jgi:hypothetical protein